MSSTPPPAGSTGTTTAGSTDQSGWSHPPNTSKPATLRSYPRCSPYESGTKPGALQWLDPGHLAFFILDAVDQFDLSRFEARYRRGGRGGVGYAPKVMVRLLLFGYCEGVRSSR